MAAALCYGSHGGGASLAFHVHAGNYDTDTLVLVIGELRRFLGDQKATLLWDGLGAHRSRAMGNFLATQRDWLVVERLPAYAPDLNPVEGLWSNLEDQELANLACDTLGEAIQSAWHGIQRVRQARVAAVFVPATGWTVVVVTPRHSTVPTNEIGGTFEWRAAR